VHRCLTGVLLNSGDAIERLAEIDRVVFDRNGTLTLPELDVTNARRCSAGFVRTGRTARRAGWRRLRRTTENAWQDFAIRAVLRESVMTSGMRMDVAEIVVLVLMVIWGPPLLFVAFLLLPVKLAQARRQ
jgi:magnesium-transporting ATPase (P-type)